MTKNDSCCREVNWRKRRHWIVGWGWSWITVLHNWSFTQYCINPMLHHFFTQIRIKCSAIKRYLFHNVSNSSLELYQDSVFPLSWSSSHTLHLPLFSYMYLCWKLLNPYVIFIWPYLLQDSAACIDQGRRERDRAPERKKERRRKKEKKRKKKRKTKNKNKQTKTKNKKKGKEKKKGNKNKKPQNQPPPKRNPKNK